MIIRPTTGTLGEGPGLTGVPSAWLCMLLCQLDAKSCLNLCQASKTLACLVLQHANCSKLLLRPGHRSQAVFDLAAASSCLHVSMLKQVRALPCNVIACVKELCLVNCKLTLETCQHLKSMHNMQTLRLSYCQVQLCSSTCKGLCTSLPPAGGMHATVRPPIKAPTAAAVAVAGADMMLSTAAGISLGKHLSCPCQGGCLDHLPDKPQLHTDHQRQRSVNPHQLQPAGLAQPQPQQQQQQQQQKHQAHGIRIECEGMSNGIPQLVHALGAARVVCLTTDTMPWLGPEANTADFTGLRHLHLRCSVKNLSPLLGLRFPQLEHVTVSTLAPAEDYSSEECTWKVLEVTAGISFSAITRLPLSSLRRLIMHRCLGAATDTVEVSDAAVKKLARACCNPAVRQSQPDGSSTSQGLKPGVSVGDVKPLVLQLVPAVGPGLHDPTFWVFQHGAPQLFTRLPCSITQHPALDGSAKASSCTCQVTQGCYQESGCSSGKASVSPGYASQQLSQAALCISNAKLQAEQLHWVAEIPVGFSTLDFIDCTFILQHDAGTTQNVVQPDNGTSSAVAGQGVVGQAAGYGNESPDPHSSEVAVSEEGTWLCKLASSLRAHVRSLRMRSCCYQTSPAPQTPALQLLQPAANLHMDDSDVNEAHGWHVVRKQSPTTSAAANPLTLNMLHSLRTCLASRQGCVLVHD